MVGGKVCNKLTKITLTLSCFYAKPLEINDLKDVIQKLSRVKNYNFGLSSVHSWIRFFECYLHIGYRLGIMSWQARGEN